MPSKIDSVVINNELFDKRVKLTFNQKQEIIYIREKQQISYQKIANMFGVSKRTIIFICKPETLTACLEKREIRGGLNNLKRNEMRAVEWLEQEIFRKYKFTLQQLNCQPLEEAIEQAKEMEKQQQGYSEEEVIGFLADRERDLRLYDMANNYEDTFKWFEQFKKK